MAINNLQELKDFLRSKECDQTLPILPYQLLQAIEYLEEEINKLKDE